MGRSPMRGAKKRKKNRQRTKMYGFGYLESMLLSEHMTDPVPREECVESNTSNDNGCDDHQEKEEE